MNVRRLLTVAVPARVVPGAMGVASTGWTGTTGATDGWSTAVDADASDANATVTGRPNESADGVRVTGDPWLRTTRTTGRTRRTTKTERTTTGTGTTRATTAKWRRPSSATTGGTDDRNRTRPTVGRPAGGGAGRDRTTDDDGERTETDDEAGTTDG